MTETPNKTWTKRWSKLKPHDVQIALWNDPHRFKVVPSGRRSGKTELAKRRLAEHLFRRTWHGRPGRYFAGAPTYNQARHIFWNDLKALVPREWVQKISEGDLMIRTKRGSELFVVGLDRAARVEGQPWDGGVIDEYANCKPGIFQNHIRPALADRKGWLWFIGVPDVASPGQIEYLDFYNKAKSADPNDRDWAAFHWPSADILPPEEVEAARRDMDPQTFAQEMLGQFNLAGGRAIPAFGPRHYRSVVEYNPMLSLCWSLDFNVDPMCSGVLQFVPGVKKAYVLHEITLNNSSTPSACREMFRLSDEKGWDLKGLIVYGDASGSARDSTSGTSDWKIIRNMLDREIGEDQWEFRLHRRNPAPKNTLNALNAMVMNEAGHIGLFVDPSCRGLIANMERSLWPSDLEEWHHLSWMRYFAEKEFPIRTDTTAEDHPTTNQKAA